MIQTIQEREQGEEGRDRNDRQPLTGRSSSQTSFARQTRHREWKRLIIDNGILLGLLAGTFTAGWLTHTPPNNKDVAITETSDAFAETLFRNLEGEQPPTADTSSPSITEHPEAPSSDTPKTTDQQTSNTSNSDTTPPSSQRSATTGTYVASVNGEKYYPSACSAVKRIKDENKRYFNTEEEAQRAGLTRTTVKSCDTLW